MHRKQDNNGQVLLKLSALDGSVIEHIQSHSYLNGEADTVKFRDTVYYSHMDVVVTSMTSSSSVPPAFLIIYNLGQ